jgi:hypothetical protein
MSRDVGLGYDTTAGARFIDHGDAPNLILLHHPAAILDAHFRRNGHTGAGHASVINTLIGVNMGTHRFLPGVSAGGVSGINA